ncbi:MAG: DUF438 domain-containing protein, partial [Chloroflexi bacterium]|nr:DUF438 domain-containing protein [Chloroflexota bacterium]
MNVTASSTRTINVKGLGHTEKEGLIFPSVEALKAGETLRIVLEFNPVPLVYLLKAQGLEVAYEKEGPDEWILGVTRTAPAPDKKQQFKEILNELKAGEVSPEAKEKARALLQEVDAKTLGVLEQELIREGVSHDTIRKSLCDIHLDIMRDSLVAKRIAVEAPHPVHTFMEEHKVIVENLHELKALVDRLKGVNSYAEMGGDLAKLQDIAHHLVEAEAHHLREEEALFPAIEKHDITEPPQIMREEHVEFRQRKKELYMLSLRYEEHPFPEFKTSVIELGDFIAKELESHIFKEDNILYQIALQVLTPQEWEYIKKLCDKIGYCCFTPGDRKEEDKKMVDLDLRQIMPFERHELIFEKWDALKPGETLRIINDHDPKPLHYQFEAEYK